MLAAANVNFSFIMIVWILPGIVRARKLFNVTMANIKQNLFFAIDYNSGLLRQGDFKQPFAHARIRRKFHFSQAACHGFPARQACRPATPE